jgi:hypothetical protein
MVSRHLLAHSRWRLGLVRGNWQRRLTLLGWGMLFLLALRFIERDVIRYFAFDETIFGRFWPRRMWLLAHSVGGMVALLSGPFQFWPGLRQRFLTVHRWTGRLYIIGTVLAAGSALRLAFFIPSSEGGRAAGLALFVLALFWLTASAMGLVAIRSRLFEIHREWMVRSYVLAFAFVNIRWWFDLPLFSNIEAYTERVITVVWVSWSLPLFATEVILQWKRMRSGGRTAEFPN